ncbi:uncharacterized protein L3040_006379 [Drepanopeziza brunnea f. sp. 'multigermtubi']|uniref:uncharacterized protein n=1 Tax=Drepanopeziza brunnea f. sp. 'multigermtubi' TaxID=698441 RepID=UPI002387D4D2|nr:hypothetical protein L3040_006379 [Drepanopeziza brunnea f. sp. 'multigermtubi']
MPQMQTVPELRMLDVLVQMSIRQCVADDEEALAAEFSKWNMRKIATQEKLMFEDKFPTILAKYWELEGVGRKTSVELLVEIEADIAAKGPLCRKWKLQSWIVYYRTKHAKIKSFWEKEDERERAKQREAVELSTRNARRAQESSGPKTPSSRPRPPTNKPISREWWMVDGMFRESIMRVRESIKDFEALSGSQRSSSAKIDYGKNVSALALLRRERAFFDKKGLRMWKEYKFPRAVLTEWKVPADQDLSFLFHEIETGGRLGQLWNIDQRG